MGYNLLKDKLHRLWRPSEALNITDLGNNYYLIKFVSVNNYTKALHQGPWFIGPQYLSVRQWEPKFNPHNAQPMFVTIWIRLQDLLTKFYDILILKKIAQLLGTLLKIDICTVQANRGLYARLCILAPLGRPLPIIVLLDTHLQQIYYQNTKPLCILCGYLGHINYQCQINMGTKNSPTNDDAKQPGTSEGPWKTIVYPKRKGK